MGLLSLLSNIVYGTPTPSQEPHVPNVERQYGWKKGDKYTTHPKMLLTVSKSHNTIKHIDLRVNCPPVYDQGKLGSCTANSIGFCYHYDELAQNESSPFVPSRLFIYYNEREVEGHVKEDTGAQIHDGIQVLNTIGVCPETDWPYDISKFADKPTDACFEEASNHRSIEYNAINQNMDQLKACLISGFPVAFGFVVYESFESQQVASTGVVPMPKPNEKILGGHAVAIVGFDDNKKQFIVRNSWGDGWGDKGYFYMDYDFVLNKDLADDFWTIKKTVDTDKN